MEKSAVHWLISQIIDNGQIKPNISPEIIEEALTRDKNNIIQAVNFGLSFASKTQNWQYSSAHAKFMHRGELYFVEKFEQPSIIPPTNITTPSIVNEIFAFIEEGKISELAELKEWFQAKEKAYYFIPEPKSKISQAEFEQKFKEVLNEIKEDFKKFIEELS